MNDVMKVSLSSKQFQWLKAHKVLSDDLMGRIEVAALQRREPFLLPSDVAESISDALTLALGAIGFDDKNQLTDDGQILEELIDSFTYFEQE